MSTTPQVYAAINAVQAAMAREGIAKSRKNQQQGYSFRGIDDVYAALAPMLAAHGLCILPRVIDRTVLERETKNGGNLLYTTLKVEFDFVSVADGSKHTICTVGEAMDSGDKSSNKAQSAAFKYACFMAFCIPTEGDNDPDATTHEVATKSKSVEPAPTLKPLTPATEKALRALGSDPQGRAYVERILNAKHLANISEMDETMALKAVEWITKELNQPAA